MKVSHMGSIYIEIFDVKVLYTIYIRYIFQGNTVLFIEFITKTLFIGAKFFLELLNVHEFPVKIDLKEC